MKRAAPFLATILALVLISVVAIRLDKGRPKAAKPLTVSDVARSERSTADAKYNSKQGRALYEGFVKKWASSPDPKVQDEVGAARLRIAFLSAKSGEYGRARNEFLQTAALYKGTGTMARDFGGLKDQALYQAAVCLVGEGKKEEARTRFVQFMREQPLSPLVNAAYRRIVRIDGKANTEIDALLQSALDRQRKFVDFETSVCGPKAIAYLLQTTKGEKLDYKQLAKECGTTDKGTTLDAMRSCLKGHGETFVGMKLNRRDFPRMPVPAILLEDDHYLVITKIERTAYTVYDPIYKHEDTRPLPALDSPNFTVAVLARPETLQKVN